MRIPSFTHILTWLGALLLPLAAHAGSFSLNEQSVSSLGSAFAGAASQASDASVLFFNPAGIVLLDQGELQLGGHLIAPSATFSNQGSRYSLSRSPFEGLITGGNGGDASVLATIPNFYLTQPVLRNSRYGDLSVGLGVSSPFGLQTNYDSGWVGRYQALRTKVTTFDIQPTVAYRIFDRLSLGASVDIQYASARLTQAVDFNLAARQLLEEFYAGLPNPFPGVTPLPFGIEPFPDGVSEVTGDDWSFGYTLGALLEYKKSGEGEFFQEGHLGVSFRSGIDHTLEGRGDFRRVPAIVVPGGPAPFPFPDALRSVFFAQDASAQLDLPEIVRVSVYQRFAQRFAIMGDVTWTHWSRLQTVPIVFSNPGTPASVLQINYDDATRYAVGFEWAATKRLTLRTGFAYDETPIRSEQFRTPRIPDNDRYFLSAGARWTATSWMDLDVGYAHLFVNDSATNLTDSQGHNLRGSYDASVDILSASVTLRWGGPRETPQYSGKDSAIYRK